MPEVTFLEKLQTPADTLADELRENKEESSLYGAKWLTTEDTLSDYKGYAKYTYDAVIGGGGGGEVEINNPTLTINYHQNGYTEPVPFGRVFKLEESTGYIALIDGYLTTNQILLDGEDGQIKLYMNGNDVELIFNSSITNITATDEINCELWSEGIVSGITVENSQENASISISYTFGSI